jgi:hypothetical protein
LTGTKKEDEHKIIAVQSTIKEQAKTSGEEVLTKEPKPVKDIYFEGKVEGKASVKTGLRF